MSIQTFSSTIRRREMDAVLTCMVEEKIGPGELSQRLIQVTKENFGVDGAVALRSPSIALRYALQALDIPKGSQIALSALAPYWQIVTLEDLGYEPIVVDVVPETGIVNFELVQKAATDGAKLLILHEPLGLVPDFDALKEIGIPFIEDISQSAGALYKEKTVGTFGIFSIFGLEEKDIVTAGGGAMLMASERRDWIVLKRLTDKIPSTDILPDINAALALVQLKEFPRNEEVRRGIYEVFYRSLMQGKHKTCVNLVEHADKVVYSFPVILNSGYKEVKQYTSRKDIEITPAFEETVVALREESLEHCTHARSLRLRCVLFPLYPRLGAKNSEKIAKILATLP